MNNKETIQHIIETTPNQRRNNKTNKVNPIHSEYNEYNEERSDRSELKGTERNWKEAWNGNDNKEEDSVETKWWMRRKERSAQAKIESKTLIKERN